MQIKTLIKFLTCLALISICFVDVTEEVKGHGSARGIPAQGGDAVPREATPVRKSRREVRELR